MIRGTLTDLASRYAPAAIELADLAYSSGAVGLSFGFDPGPGFAALLGIEFVDFSIGAKAYRRSAIRPYAGLISEGSAYVLDLVYYVHRDGGRRPRRGRCRP